MQTSMDGRGRALDNMVVERLCRTVQCEEVYVDNRDTPQGDEPAGRRT
jgi:putative transposase